MYKLPPLRPENILIYLRKSRADDPSLSVSEVLEKHEQMLNDWCMQNLGKLVPEENRFREVVSGETIDSRPEICNLLRKIENPRYKAILIVEPQRLSRGDLEDIGRLSKIFRYTKTLVITLQYIYDPTDARDREDLERELKRGNEYLEYSKRIMLNGRILSVQKGNFIGQSPPYGYKKVKVRDGKQSFFTLEPDEKEAPYIEMIFKMYAAGNGTTKIAKQLQLLGAPTRSGNIWSPATLERVILNPHYLGKVIWNRRKKETVVKNGVIYHTRPEHDDYMIFEGKHSALISEELWNAVKERRSHIPKVKKNVELSNPLAGLVYCSCGHAMTRRVYKKNGKECSQPRLACTKQSNCHTPSVLHSELLNAITKEMQTAIGLFSLQISNRNEQINSGEPLKERYEKRLAELDTIEITQWEQYTCGKMPETVFEALNKKLLNERKKVTEALNQERENALIPQHLEERRSTFTETLALLSNPEAPASAQNALLSQCISRVVYSRSASAEPFTLSVDLKI